MPFKLLLLEDEEADVLYVRFLLENPALSPGYQLVWVASVAELQEALRSCRPDALLVDLGLPGCTGLEACAQALSATDAAVLVLTGRCDELLAIEAVARGAQDYLLKDELDGMALEKAIRYAIERQRVRQQLAAQLQSSKREA